MRKYALVILNNEDKQIDRFNLDLITNPTGNGFELSLSTINSDIEDLLTRVVQKKSTISFTINLVNNSYSKSYVLADWIQKYSTTEYRMALEYYDGNNYKYCEGKVISLTKTEKDEFGNLAQVMTFQQLTPFFYKRENTIEIKVASVGKQYPFKYGYSYGANITLNNNINNPYILDIPIIITINGAISNPSIDLVDENNASYNRVQFSGVVINESERLVINSAQRKIYKINADGTTTDFKPEVDPSNDTFLRAKRGLSKIIINTNDAGTGFKLIGGWREYSL